MKGIAMLKTLSTAVLLAVAGAAFAQNTPSQTPAVTPSQTPAITPSQTPAVTPSQGSIVSPPGAVGGLSRCENMIGLDRDSCLQQERAGTGSTGPGSSSGGSTSGTSTQPTAPIGSPTGTVR
jgi:hypothetical protein